LTIFDSWQCPGGDVDSAVSWTEVSPEAEGSDIYSLAWPITEEQSSAWPIAGKLTLPHSWLGKDNGGFS